MAKNFSKTMTASKPEIEESQIMSSKINTKKKGWRVNRMRFQDMVVDCEGSPRCEHSISSRFFFNVARKERYGTRNYAQCLKSQGNISLRSAPSLFASFCSFPSSFFFFDNIAIISDCVINFMRERDVTNSRITVKIC